MTTKFKCGGDGQIKENTFFASKCVPPVIRLLISKIQKPMKNGLQKLSKWVTLFRGWRLLGRHWCPKPFFNIKRKPKCSQSAPKSCKSLHKVTPNEPKRLKHDFESASAFENWPGGQREASLNKKNEALPIGWSISQHLRSEERLCKHLRTTFDVPRWVSDYGKDAPTHPHQATTHEKRTTAVVLGMW